MERKKQRGNTRYWNLNHDYDINKLLEYVADEISKMNDLEKDLNIRPLIQRILEYGTRSPREAIGAIECVKAHFVLLAGEKEEGNQRLYKENYK